MLDIRLCGLKSVRWTSFLFFSEEKHYDWAFIYCSSIEFDCISVDLNHKRAGPNSCSFISCHQGEMIHLPPEEGFSLRASVRSEASGCNSGATNSNKSGLFHLFLGFDLHFIFREKELTHVVTHVLPRR